MPDSRTAPTDPVRQRLMALSRWDNEGGALPGFSQPETTAAREHPNIPEMNNAELVQLQIRVIALENLVISLLAEASDLQLDLVREMAATITRPGFTQHPLTIHAADQMNHLVDRAGHFRAKPSGSG